MYLHNIWKNDDKPALKSYVKKEDKNLNELMDYAKKLDIEKLIQANLAMIL